jgi:hypothetical protein
VSEIESLKIHIHGNLQRLKSADIEIGENNFVETIDIKTVAAMFSEYERSKLVRNVPTGLLVSELKQRIKNRLNRSLRFMRRR